MRLPKRVPWERPGRKSRYRLRRDPGRRRRRRGGAPRPPLGERALAAAGLRRARAGACAPNPVAGFFPPPDSHASPGGPRSGACDGARRLGAGRAPPMGCGPLGASVAAALLRTAAVGAGAELQPPGRPRAAAARLLGPRLHPARCDVPLPGRRARSHARPVSRPGAPPPLRRLEERRPGQFPGRLRPRVVVALAELGSR